MHIKLKTAPIVLYLGAALSFVEQGYASSAPLLPSPVTAALGASTQLENQVRDAVAEAIQKFMHGRTKKFTASASANYGWYKDDTSFKRVKGSSKAGFVALAYQVAPNVSLALAGGKSLMSGRSDDGALFNKMNDDLFAISADYKVNPWLTLCAAVSQTYGQFVSIQAGAQNERSVSKYVYTTPTFMARMVIPVYQKLVFVPEVGVSQMYIHNRAYLDNASVNQPTQHKRMDLAFLDVRMGYNGFAMATPYIRAGYGRAVQTSASVKSRNSTKVGAGVAVMNGLVAVEYMNQRVWGQFQDQQIKINVNVRF